MKRLSRTATATAAVLAAASVGGAAAFAVPASAATPVARTVSAAPASAAAKAAPAAVAPAVAYNGVCGTGYSVIDSTPIGSVGTVYVTWNNATGKNCVVTVRNTPGAAVLMNAMLWASADPAGGVSDEGKYTTYAGPVYLNARGQCITWSGRIGNVFAGNSGHCG